jgi:hypothetical protein
MKPIIPDPELEQLSFFTAVQEIRGHRGMTIGMAQRALRELCASGLVRSWKQPYSMVRGEPQGEGPPEPIEPVEWQTRQIDLMRAADGCSYWVEVSVSDLRGWLNQQPVRKGQRARKKALGKRPRIKLMLAERFPKGVPDPGYCNRQVLAKELCEIDPTLNPLDPDTLKTAIDEHNSSLIRNDPT